MTGHSKAGHSKDCLWATPLPTGWPHFWGCDCGFTDWEIENEDYEIPQKPYNKPLAHELGSPVISDGTEADK